MRKAPHPVNLYLASLKRNLFTGLYEITESGITYSMDLETTRLLKASFQNNAACKKISEWYNQLDKDQRGKVTRTGALPIYVDAFYPDQEFD